MKLRDAIIQVLAEAAGPLEIGEVEEQVAGLKTEPTSQSVGYILTTGATAEKGKFTRVATGVYALRAEGEGPSEKRQRATVAA